MAAEGYLVQRSDYDSVLRYIFVLNGDRYFSGIVRRTYSLDESGSSPRVVSRTREDVQKPGKPSNRSPGPVCIRDTDHILTALWIERR